LVITSCNKDDKDKFDYDINLLHGTWRVTHLEMSTGWSTWLLGRTTATFNPNGTYSGAGYFGTGSGTYKATGKTVITYIGGDEFYRYDVISLSATNAELRMYEKGTEGIKIRVVKE